LIGSHLGWSTIAVPGDEPGFVVASGKLDERGSRSAGSLVHRCPKRKRNRDRQFVDGLCMRIVSRSRLPILAYAAIGATIGHSI
jgi:hypothetical protein